MNGVPDGDCWAVIFVSRRRVGDDGYAATAAHMVELARQMPGFLGMESVRDADGLGITVSYWRTLEDIEAWREHEEHREARRLGREKWYESFSLRVARVERSAYWSAGSGGME